jgi:hypothetical protein
MIFLNVPQILNHSYNFVTHLILLAKKLMSIDVKYLDRLRPSNFAECLMLLKAFKYSGILRCRERVRWLAKVNDSPQTLLILVTRSPSEGAVALIA